MAFVFFGPVAVAATYFLHSGTWTIEAIVAGAGPGLLAAAILTVNNLRDMDTDRAAGKQTLAVRFGAGFARAEYLGCVIGAAVVPTALAIATGRWAGALPLMTLIAAMPWVLVVLRPGSRPPRSQPRPGGHRPHHAHPRPAVLHRMVDRLKLRAARPDRAAPLPRRVDRAGRRRTPSRRGAELPPAGRGGRRLGGALPVLRTDPRLTAYRAGGEQRRAGRVPVRRVVRGPAAADPEPAAAGCSACASWARSSAAARRSPPPTWTCRAAAARTRSTPHAPATALLTSGSTGNPRAVVHTLANHL